MNYKRKHMRRWKRPDEGKKLKRRSQRTGRKLMKGRKVYFPPVEWRLVDFY